MKKLAVLAMTFFFALSVTQGQARQTDKKESKETKKELKAERVALKKLEGSVVSNLSKSSFYAVFGNLSNVQWKRVDTFDEAAFTKDGQPMKAFFDIDGNLVGTTQVKTFADVPARGQKEINARYKDYKVERVIFFDDNEANSTDMILYGTQFEDADNYFVELSNGTKKIVLQVSPEGIVYFFTQL